MHLRLYFPQIHFDALSKYSPLDLNLFSSNSCKIPYRLVLGYPTYQKLKHPQGLLYPYPAGSCEAIHRAFRQVVQTPLCMYGFVLTTFRIYCLHNVNKLGGGHE
jgi:hypothetical protein